MKFILRRIIKQNFGKIKRFSDKPTEDKKPKERFKIVSKKITTEGTGPLFLGIHAAYSYARAGLVNEKGHIVKVVLEPMKTFDGPIFKEQSTKEIWTTVVDCVKNLIKEIDVSRIKGIGIVAVRSLVCLDEKYNPVSVSVTENPELNVISKHDIRSIHEAEYMNQKHHEALRYFGERATPSIHLTKLMWLKTNLRKTCWERSGKFMDLSDFLTWKVTGSEIRSSCNMETYWSYQKTDRSEGWDGAFFRELGLEDMEADKWKKLAAKVECPGTPLAQGLNEETAKLFGLPKGIPVGTSIEDSHAGALALLGCKSDGVDGSFSSRLCLVCSTVSASHFALSYQPTFVEGVWGPFKDCLVPGTWLSHAGQFAAESLVEHVIDHHIASAEIRKRLGHMNIQRYLNKLLKVKAKNSNLQDPSYLTKNLHVCPDFRGNRSPLADPTIKGMISGLSLDSNQESLALLYLATMQSLAYSTKRIINTLGDNGFKIKSVIIGGGLGKNSLFLSVHKDACQLPVVSPAEATSKIVGAAILGSVAAQHFMRFEDAISTMGGTGTTLLPNKEMAEYHDRKYQVFLKLYQHQLEYRRMMYSK